jgi:hypothetical protein
MDVGDQARAEPRAHALLDVLQLARRLLRGEHDLLVLLDQELKVKKNSSWLASLPQMNCTSSTISTSTLRNSSLNWPVFLVRSAVMKRFTKLSAVR